MPGRYTLMRPGLWSDADPAEDLAGVLTGQSGAFQCVRSRGGDAVAEQPCVLAGRVDVDRPSPASMFAQQTPTIVQRGGEVDRRECRRAWCKPIIVPVMSHLSLSVRLLPHVPPRSAATVTRRASRGSFAVLDER